MVVGPRNCPVCSCVKTALHTRRYKQRNPLFYACISQVLPSGSWETGLEWQHVKTPNLQSKMCRPILLRKVNMFLLKASLDVEKYFYHDLNISHESYILVLKMIYSILKNVNMFLLKTNLNVENVYYDLDISHESYIFVSKMIYSWYR